MNESSTTPDRSAVEEIWEALIEGRLTRREVHVWAGQWVNERDADIADPLVRKAVQYLHGFGLRRSKSDGSLVSDSFDGDYLHDEQEVRMALDRWRNACVEFDRDPRGYIDRVRREALQKLSE